MAGILSLKYAKVRIIFLPDQISGIWNFYKINHSTENYGDLLDNNNKKNGKIICLVKTKGTFCLNPEYWETQYSYYPA